MNIAKPDAVVLLSGGLDSMVTGAIALELGFSLNALSIDYGQRHGKELLAADRIADTLKVKRHAKLAVDLQIFGGSALTGSGKLPKGGLEEGIPATYVPGRNLVFLSLALSWADAILAQDIFIGVNAIDYSGYPDCRPEFIKSFAKTAVLATRLGAHGQSIKIHAPLQYMSKAEIVSESARLGLDPGESWSCYDPLADGKACGLCDSCRLRRTGFRQADLTDPTEYAFDPDCADDTD